LNLLSKDSIKRNYFYARQGWGVIAPIFGIANFMMLIYLTTNNVIPIWIFAPVFVILLCISLTLTGKHFRNLQMETDLNLSYRKAAEACKTDRVLFDQLEQICAKLDIKPRKEFYERRELLKNIEDGTSN
jgi:uncharacterized membrane protein